MPLGSAILLHAPALVPRTPPSSNPPHHRHSHSGGVPRPPRGAAASPSVCFLPGPAARRRPKGRADRVDKESLPSEQGPVSPAAAAVEYVRDGRREFFVHAPGRQPPPPAAESCAPDGDVQKRTDADQDNRQKRRRKRSKSSSSSSSSSSDTSVTSTTSPSSSSSSSRKSEAKQTEDATSRNSGHTPWWRRTGMRRAGAAHRSGDVLTVRETVMQRSWRGRAVDRVIRLLLPAGYPQSVGPGFLDYTRWRLCAFFFGGAVGVFSTQGLLLAVGVGRESAAPLAAALQWVIRDGMGRAGRMVFSQVGNGFDAETKQYRLMAAFVLNMSCALESVTPAIMPQLFLPLACVANMAKGAATVAAASTRSAIYRGLMRRENLGDITAKQETVGVLGDLLGTAVGIGLSRATAGSARAAAIAFCVVSAAHLASVYREIKAIQLSTLNRQRAHYLIKHYLEQGTVPDLKGGNLDERILNRPWLDSLHAPNIDLGARLHECAPDAEALQYLLRMYKDERYLFTYEGARMKVVLRNDAKSLDCLKAFMQADYFWRRYKEKGLRHDRNRDLVEEAHRFTNRHFAGFARECQRNGWLVDSVQLRPIGRRASWNRSERKVF